MFQRAVPEQASAPDQARIVRDQIRKRKLKAARRTKWRSRCTPACSCSAQCCWLWARRVTVLLAVCFIMAVCLASTYDWSEQRRAHELLDSAKKHFGEGEGVHKNLKSEYLYKQALAAFEFSEASGMRMTLNAAILRLCRMPVILMRSATGASAQGGWASVRRRLAYHAKRLREATGK